MAHTLKLDANTLYTLDLSGAQAYIEPLMDKGNLLDPEVRLQFEIDFPREPTDPRELSEIPEVRLWFIRLDALYPWLPYLLDWEAGELGRYAAMLVPHQFSPKDGIRYNPEALEIFVMQKIFVVARWLRSQNNAQTTRLKFMTQMLGYEIEDGLFDLLMS
ncbi:CRR6 family NdhI maturation factor [Halomicronema sp. CCY15110]|uniref:CRR6 family NdhI maturation factor n=1 Tax=Halomicronema sp. CCY15110 TaxID=2767773 RepID=UPI0019526E04|nr:CRR6 family NdhI maturation factor [Halomicronema sp. CCY15110]